MKKLLSAAAILALTAFGCGPSETSIDEPASAELEGRSAGDLDMNAQASRQEAPAYGTQAESETGYATRGSEPAAAGASVSGEVVSIQGDRLVLDTDSGRQTIVLGDLTERPSDLREGIHVTVNRRPDGAASAIVIDRSASGSQLAQARSADRDRNGQTVSERESLPATASPLPLIGLGGLMALGIGAGLRRFASQPARSRG